MHADKLINHVRDRDGRVELLTIPAPKTDFDSPLQAAEYVRDLERATTETIHRLFELARKEADYPLEVLLHWYINEQVEEEQWSGELAGLVHQFHEHQDQLIMLDQQWGKRAEQM
jgi:ferritin